MIMTGHKGLPALELRAFAPADIIHCISHFFLKIIISSKKYML
jgi:hypothetical protein